MDQQRASQELSLGRFRASIAAAFASLKIGEAAFGQRPVVLDPPLPGVGGRQLFESFFDDLR